MFFERIYDTDLAQASYVIGCQGNGEAVVIDARRDIAIYHEIAAANDLEITAVTETHVHADYLLGTHELAADTGASMYVSGEGGPDWLYDFDANLLNDGGTITLTAVHTPGRTPEHLTFQVTDGAFSNDPGYALTGDFVFCGDLGRPDLLDEVAGGVDTRFAGAKQMFASLRDKFLTLPDDVQVHPAHGAGSACGKALGAVPCSTVGYEQLNAWWSPYLEADDEEGFVAELLDGQPDAPAYFGRMKRQNVAGPAVLGERTPLAELDVQQVAASLAANEATFVDTRANTEVHHGTVAGSVNIPATKSMATYGAWAIEPVRDARPLVLWADRPESTAEMWDHLIRVGVDDVSGYVTTIEGLPQEKPRLAQPGEVADFDKALLLDVRAKSEYKDGKAPGAEQLHGGRVLWNLEKLPNSGTIVTYCQTGVRSSVVASTLRHAGYDVVELEGSYNAWAEQHAK